MGMVSSITFPVRDASHSSMILVKILSGNKPTSSANMVTTHCRLYRKASSALIPLRFKEPKTAATFSAALTVTSSRSFLNLGEEGFGRRKLNESLRTGNSSSHVHYYNIVFIGLSAQGKYLLPRCSVSVLHCVIQMALFALNVRRLGERK